MAWWREDPMTLRLDSCTPCIRFCIGLWPAQMALLVSWLVGHTLMCWRLMDLVADGLMGRTAHGLHTLRSWPAFYGLHTFMACKRLWSA